MIHKLIESLTPEQEADLPHARERWRSAGLSTAPIHAEAARKAARALYAAGSAPEPTAVIVLASPMACLIARAIVERRLVNSSLGENQRAPLEKKLWDQLGGELGGQLGGQLWGQLRDQLRGRLWGQLRDQLGAQLRDQLWDQLWGQLGGQLRDQLRGRLWDQLRDQLGGQLGGELRGHLGGQLWGQLAGQLGGQLGDQLGDQLWGQLGGQLWDQLAGELYQGTDFIGGQDVFWLAIYDFGERIGAQFGPRTKAHFEAYKAYALSAGWMYPYKSIAFVSDRPAEIYFDAQRRLHCAIGMAVKFRDGWGLHAWHGLRVPSRLIDDRDKISPETIEAEGNAELRRVALEIFGFDKYLAARGAKTVAADELHGQPRRLLEVRIGAETVRIIEVNNGSLEPDGTRRKFHLGAMRGETPHDVVAASYGIGPRAYLEAVRS